MKHHTRTAFLTTLLLLGATGNALARWEQLGAGDTVYLFADRDSIRRDGTLVRMQHMLDYKEHQSEGVAPYQSWRVDAEYDCEAYRYRELSATFHPYRLGEGPAVSRTNYPGTWQAIPPDTGLDRLGRMACDRPAADKEPKPVGAPKQISPFRKK